MMVLLDPLLVVGFDPSGQDRRRLARGKEPLHTPNDAIAVTRRSPKGAIETGVQVDFVRRWPGA